MNRSARRLPRFLAAALSWTLATLATLALLALFDSTGARVLAGPAPAAGAVKTPPTETSWAAWETLEFHARPFLFFSGHVEMKLDENDARRLLTTSTRARFFGAEVANSRTWTRIDPGTGRTMEYIQLSSKRGRRYTFNETAFVVEKLKPNGRADAPHKDWKVSSRKEYEYPVDPETSERQRVFDYYGMILFLKQAGLDRLGDEVTLWVATSKGPKPYVITVSEERESQRKFRDLPFDRTRRETVTELRLRISPADPSEEDEGFLKMEGDMEIWVEAETRTLLEIDGKIPKVPGRVELSLVALG